MSEMIDRVARALYAYENGFPDDWDGPLLSERGRDMWRKQARAAIEAMREPTEAMANAAYEAGHYGDMASIWREMIDAALNGGGG